jgi:hypothetical protein
MKLGFRQIRGFLGGACLCGFISVQAVQITPTSYTFIPGARAGSYSYADETGVQLIDGLYGTAYLLEQSYADPYVGWMAEHVTINFQFAELTTFNQVTVSALQKWLGNIVLPDVYLNTSVDGVTWTPVASLITPESWLNDYAKKLLTLSGLDVTTKYLQVELKRNDKGPWIFTDEILFAGIVLDTQLTASSTAVPDASSSAALLGVALAGLSCLRRKQ